METIKYYVKSQLTKAQVCDLEIEFIEKVLIDSETEEEIYVRDLEIENDTHLYDLYKKEKGLLQSYEIKKIREKYDLNQKDFSKILGLGEITVHRYENGTIQTDGNDSIIRFVEDPLNLEKMVYKNKNKVSEYIYRDLLQRLKTFKLYM